MAPPVSRRPGFSRRAQFSLFVGYLAAAFGGLVGALLIVTAHFDPAGHNAVRALLGDIASPFSSAGRAVVRGIWGAGEGVFAYVDAGSKNRAMLTELRASRTKLIAGENAIHENERLRGLLRLAQTEGGPMIAARLISSTGSNSRRYAMIDKGALHGVVSGEPVRSVDGLVGQVVQAGAISSQILLITDSGAVVPVRRVSDGLTGLTGGTSDGLLNVHALVAGVTPFKPHDVLVTSGAGGLYPPGIPVAVVIGNGRDGAVARPLADPAELDFALIERPFVAPLPTPTTITAKPKKHHKAAE